MDDFLTGATIWVALTLYAASQIARRRPGATAIAGRWLLACGLALYIAHVVLAFDLHYDWSHATAFAETAAQTEALLGRPWGGGLYVNYFFSVIWAVEVLWWHGAPASYAGRRTWLERATRGLFLFMIVNGAVVFVDGPQRWLGVAIVGVLLLAWRPYLRFGQDAGHTQG
jgi:hypothetical protein